MTKNCATFVVVASGVWLIYWCACVCLPGNYSPFFLVVLSINFVVVVIARVIDTYWYKIFAF